MRSAARDALRVLREQRCVGRLPRPRCSRSLARSTDTPPAPGLNIERTKGSSFKKLYITNTGYAGIWLHRGSSSNTMSGCTGECTWPGTQHPPPPAARGGRGLPSPACTHLTHSPALPAVRNTGRKYAGEGEGIYIGSPGGGDSSNNNKVGRRAGCPLQPVEHWLAGQPFADAPSPAAVSRRSPATTLALA